MPLGFGQTAQMTKRSLRPRPERAGIGGIDDARRGDSAEPRQPQPQNPVRSCQPETMRGVSPVLRSVPRSYRVGDLASRLGNILSAPETTPAMERMRSDATEMPTQGLLYLDSGLAEKGPCTGKSPTRIASTSSADLQHLLSRNTNTKAHKGTRLQITAVTSS
jgi:hypothetical protein